MSQNISDKIFHVHVYVLSKHEYITFTGNIAIFFNDIVQVEVKVKNIMITNIKQNC